MPPPAPSAAQPPLARAVLDNRTDLPDAAVERAVRAQWVEIAGLQFGTPSQFQSYTASQGSMLARTPFRVPKDVIEEIVLARQVADADDDVAATIGQCISTAYTEGVRHLHEDERTKRLFDEIGKADQLGIEAVLAELHREYLVSGQITTVTAFQRSRIGYFATKGEERVTAQVASPRVGILPAENIRVLGNDIFRSGRLAYHTLDHGITDWLDEFFAERTSPGRKAEMRAQEPVMAALFTDVYRAPYNDPDPLLRGLKMYLLNPRMVHRSTGPKGASPYARPFMTRNFALLEAKRLLNIMDYAFLQGGTNYIVVAKQGSDALPAQQPEIDNLVNQVRTASRSGVLVGDHRLNIEIITPDLKEMLNPEKRKLLGQKISMAILRLPEQSTPDPGSAGANGELAFIGNTIMSDRRLVKSHIESAVYGETAKRNTAAFPKGPAALWFPKIVLTGTKDFFAAILQLRDRGDIPRRWIVESLGYDYDAALAEREREVERGDDETLAPAAGSTPGQGDPIAPADHQGRPPGSSSNNGSPQDAPQLPSARPRRVIQRTRGETVRAFYDADAGRTMRVGELTSAILDEYAETRAVGRVGQIERDAIEAGETIQRGRVVVVPVNPGHEVEELRVIRLDEGASLVLGERRDGAIVAKALSFREPHFDMTQAEDTAIRWGYPVEITGAEVEEETAAAAVPTDIVTQMAAAFAEMVKNMPQPTILLQLPGEQARRILRDENGAIVGVEPVEPEPTT